MKLKRMVACVLALLLVVSILPIGAMADETVNEESDVTLNQNYDKNTGTNVTVPENITVGINEGTITTIEEYGKVLTNNGDIVTNAGYVGDHNPDGTPVEGTGNFGTIETNSGYVFYNEKLVEHNQQGYDDTGDTAMRQRGGIRVNAGTVTSNDYVAEYNDAGEVDPFKSIIGYIEINQGSIEANNGFVLYNGSELSPDPELGVIDENRCAIYSNYGTVNTNGLQTLDQNGNPVVIEGATQYGAIGANYGTVETNAIDGVVNNYREHITAELSVEDAAPSKGVPDVLEGKVVENFGTVYDYTNCIEENDQPTIYYGLSWGDDIQSLTLIDGKMPGNADPVNLNDYAATATRSGYKMTGFTAYSRADGADTQIEKPSEHIMNAPVWLQILWEKLAGTSEPEPAKTPVYTNLSADQVRVGAFVRLGNCVFKIIEVNDDSIRVATVNKLPEEALTDMLGFLKQYLSDAQIAKLMGQPELLEQELVSKFFGGSNEHIAFYASTDLFAN